MVYLSLSCFILVYLGLFLTILVYLGASRYISLHLGASPSISVYLGLSRTDGDVHVLCKEGHGCRFHCFFIIHNAFVLLNIILINWTKANHFSPASISSLRSLETVTKSECSWFLCCS